MKSLPTFSVVLVVSLVVLEHREILFHLYFEVRSSEFPVESLNWNAPLSWSSVSEEPKQPQHQNPKWLLSASTISETVFFSFVYNLCLSVSKYICEHDTSALSAVFFHPYNAGFWRSHPLKASLFVTSAGIWISIAFKWAWQSFTILLVFTHKQTKTVHSITIFTITKLRVSCKILWLFMLKSIRWLQTFRLTLCSEAPHKQTLANVSQ